jgi:hypothetical protein
MKQIAYFEANDGTKFETQAECVAYELMSANKATIQEWCEHKYGSKQGQATAALNKIMRWEMDRKAVLEHTYEYPEVEALEVDEEAPAVSEAA